jgi:hypothetical protein
MATFEYFKGDEVIIDPLEPPLLHDLWIGSSDSSVYYNYLNKWNLLGGSSTVREVSLRYEFKDDDDGTVILLFGDHNFNFAGLEYNRVAIASNGAVHPLLPTDADLFRTNYDMPSLKYDGPIFAPYWIDHDTQESTNAGTVRYDVTSIMGKQALVVIWDNVALYFAGETSYWDSRRCRFQLIMYSDGIVEFNYGRIQLDCGAASDVWNSILGLDVWAGPIVGHWIPPFDDWEHPRSNKSIEFGDMPDDPIYIGYPLQGEFGFTDDKPFALVKASNCGIPGRYIFDFSGN